MNPEIQLQIEKLLPYLSNGQKQMSEEDLSLLDTLVRTLFNTRPVMSCGTCKMTYIERLAEYYNKHKPEAPAPIPESTGCKKCDKKNKKSK